MRSEPTAKDVFVHLSTGKFLRGGERQVLWLHQGLLQRGYDSRLLCKAGGELSRSGAAHLAPIPWRGEWDLAGLMRIVLRCKSIAPRLIHCHDAHALLHGSIAGALLNIPVVYSRRVIFPLRGNALSRWKYGRCRMILAVSSAVARQCASIAPAHNIRIVHDGVDWKRPIASRAQARATLGLGADTFVIGTVGHFTKEKNFPLIVALAEALQKSRPAVDTAACPANMVLTGHKPDAVSFYTAFDMYISTSTNEGLGSALLDAVVRDIPAIAVNAGGTADIYPDNWPLVSPGDDAGFINAVIRAIENVPAAQSAAVQCGIRARNLFSVDYMVEQSLSLYRDLLR